LNIKTVIESDDGYTYVLPIHTLEVYQEEGVFAEETEYDGYPEQFRHFYEMEKLGERFTEAVKKMIEGQYVLTGYAFSKPFFLTSFIIKKDEILHRYYDENRNIQCIGSILREFNYGPSAHITNIKLQSPTSFRKRANVYTD